MKVLKLTISCLLIFILSYGVSHAQVTTLFVAAADSCDSSEPDVSTLYRVNPINGDSMPVGPIEFEGVGFRGVTGLAFLGDGRLVGSANADDNGDRIAILIEIDPRTGQSFLIGEIGDNNTPGECGRAPDLTYDPATDTLFTVGKQCTGFGSSPGILMRINQTTGQGTQIGDTGFTGSGFGLAIRDDGTLFWGNRPGVGPNELLTINPVTGLATPVAMVSLENILLSALAFNPVTGVLFATALNPPPPFDNEDALLQIVNTTTGELTTIGQLPDCSDAIVFSPLPAPRPIPTLSEWGLIVMAGVLGIVGLLALRRRKLVA